MAWTSPLTWAVNQVLTAANMNEQVRDNTNWLANDHPRCKANRTTSQSISDGTSTAIALNAADTFDVGPMHDPASNNTRLTVPTGGGGSYIFGADGAFAGNSTGYRAMRVRLNGVTDLAEQREFGPVVSIGTNINLAGAHQLAAGDYLEVLVVQTSGGALDFNQTSLWAFWQGF